MTNNHHELSKGDWIVHNRHGLGQITGTDTKELLGERKDFFIVKTESITYWLLQSESCSGRIRPVASSETFGEALNLISQAPKPLEENFRRRLANIHERIQSTALLSRAELIRDMNGRDVEKDVHINERKILDTLESRFINEWVAASGIDPEVANIELHVALGKSSVTLKKKKAISSKFI